MQKEGLKTEIKLPRPQILIVDDEVAMVRLLEMLFRPVGDVRKAYSVPEAEEELGKTGRIDCIVTDVSMPEASGLDLLDRVRKKNPEIPVVVMTAYSSVPQAVEAMQRGAFQYLVKPFENTEMLDTVQRAIQSRGFALGETKKIPTGWACNSSVMKDFLVKAERVAASDSPLLISGETGVGKRRLAQWLHERSTRSKREFFSVDARSHDEDSAVYDAKRLQKVGSLYVAEIFSATSKLQNRLLEIHNEGKIRLMGSTTSASVFQTPENYRPELLQVFSTVMLRLPSLHDRKEDLESLANECLLDLSRRMKIPKLELLPDALQKLKAHTFTGNVRELEQLLERAALESKAGVISDELIHFENAELQTLLPFTVPVDGGWTRLELLQESLEKELIQRALKKYPDYSNTQIASCLGTTRRILELRMKAYRIRESS